MATVTEQSLFLLFISANLAILRNTRLKPHCGRQRSWWQNLVVCCLHHVYTSKVCDTCCSRQLTIHNSSVPCDEYFWVFFFFFFFSCEMSVVRFPYLSTSLGKRKQGLPTDLLTRGGLFSPLAWDSGPLPGTPGPSGPPTSQGRMYPSTCGTSDIPVRREREEKKKKKRGRQNRLG